MNTENKSWEESFKQAFSSFQTELNELNKELEREKDKNRCFSEIVSEGIFFLNSSFYIQQGYTQALELIIEESDLTNINFVDLLAHRVPDNVIQQTAEYLEFMFRSDLDEETINELNQLENIEFYYKDQWGFWTTTHFLSFRFKRVYEEDNIIALICSVRDISREEKLHHKLDEFEKNTKKQMERLVNILHVKPALLQEFIQLIKRELEVINQLLKNPDNNNNYQKMVQSLQRSARYILNNAMLLDLKFFAANTQEFLDEVEKLRTRQNICGTDFVPLVLNFSELRLMLEEIQELTLRLEHFSSSIRTTRRYESKLLVKSLGRMVDALSTETHKKIRLIHSSFDSLTIPYEHQQLVKELLFSFTRFIILYHSETPEARRSSNMNPEVTIEISSSLSRKHFEFVVKHDGRLQSLERIVQKKIDDTAVTDGSEYDSEMVSQLGIEISQLFFTPVNLIKSEGDNEDDGSLVSMELVKKKLAMYGGKTRIVFTSELSTEYHITIPLKSDP